MQPRAAGKNRLLRNVAGLRLVLLDLQPINILGVGPLLPLNLLLNQKPDNGSNELYGSEEKSTQNKYGDEMKQIRMRMKVLLVLHQVGWGHGLKLRQCGRVLVVQKPSRSR